jgi:hypothetical protein
MTAVLREGDRMGLRVMECDAANRRIVLAITQMPEPRPFDEEAEAELAANASVEDGATSEDGGEAGAAATTDAGDAEAEEGAPASAEAVETPADAAMSAQPSADTPGEEPQLPVDEEGEPAESTEPRE